MGKDQKTKRHGLDVRKNRRMKEQLREVFTPKKAPKQHKG